MKKLIIIILLLPTIVFAESSLLKNFYVGVDTSFFAKGEEFFGSFTNAPQPEEYSVESAMLYKIGY